MVLPGHQGIWVSNFSTSYHCRYINRVILYLIFQHGLVSALLRNGQDALRPYTSFQCIESPPNCSLWIGSNVLAIKNNIFLTNSIHKTSEVIESSNNDVLSPLFLSWIYFCTCPFSGLELLVSLPLSFSGRV